ncbi:MAG: hypothetical protein MUF48_04615 [Pirellulaceae bacterium]|jgi:hypothetical protein|nr:hypothetical protein [Pirellulaceae bacterium]
MRCAHRSAPVVLLLLLALLPLLLTCTTGCAVLYQLAYGDGPTVPPKFSALKGKRVAVVCIMNSSAYGDGEVSMVLSDQVGRLLSQRGDKIDVVRPDEVSDWMDTNDWDESNFVDVGRGVKADMVVGIEVAAFSIHESKTLLKGRANVTTTVYDVAKGTEVFRTTDHDHSFPTSHAIPVVSTDWRSFERMYIGVLAEHIAKNFYEYSLVEDFARDGAAYAH